MSDLDYTLKEFCKDYDPLENAAERLARISRDLSFIAFSGASDSEEYALERAEVSCAQDTAREGVPLSTVHKKSENKIPCIEWTEGAGLLKVSKGGKTETPKGGQRGKVKGFSRKSRLRLMRIIAKIRLDAPLPVFITLTYPFNFPSPIESKKHLDIFDQRLRRAFPEIGFIWKLEPQERGAPHYHILAWGVSVEKLGAFIPFAWHDIAGQGDENHLRFHLGLLGNEPCVSQVRSRNGVMRYAEKYLGKTFEVAGWKEKYTGRFWAVVQKENIPFGVDMIMYIQKKDAHLLMRYQRRFAVKNIYKKIWDEGHKKKKIFYLAGKPVILKKKKMKTFSSSPSLTIFSNADKWIDNFMEVHIGNV